MKEIDRAIETLDEISLLIYKSPFEDHYDQWRALSIKLCCRTEDLIHATRLLEERVAYLEAMV